jgi:head-tail adaptor
MLSGRNIGKMDVLLTIEQQTNTRNSRNEDVASWSTFTQMFGERIWNSGGDKFEGKQETNLDNVIFNCRYNGNITTMMRLKQSTESTYFYITNVRSSIREGLTIINAERRDNQ